MEISKFRSSKKIILSNLSKIFIPFIIVIVSFIFDVINDIESNVKTDVYFSIILYVIVLCVLLIVSIVYSYFLWRNTYICLEDTSITIEKHFFTKRVNTLALKNISNINIQQTIFESLLGICNIKFDTDTFTTANETDVTIVLSKENAIKFKALLLERIHISDDSNTETDIKQVVSINTCQKDSNELFDNNFDIVFSKKEILVNSIFDYFHYIMYLFIFIAFGLFIYMISTSEDLLALHTIIKHNVYNIVFFLLVLVVTLLYPFFKYYNFKVKRSKKDIILNYGLFTKRSYNIPIDKISNVIIIQPFIMRIFHLYSVEICNIGLNDEKGETSKIILACKKDTLKKYINILLPEYSYILDKQMKKFSKTYFLYAFSYAFLLNIIISLLSFTAECLIDSSLFTYIISGSLIALVLLECFLAVLSYLTNDTYLDDNAFIFSTGFFCKKTQVISYEKMQVVLFHQSPISHFLKHGNVTIMILASLLNFSYYLPFLSEDDFEILSKKIQHFSYTL